MTSMDDNALIDALRDRFEESRRAINDLRELTGKLENINRKLQDSERLKSHFLSNIRNEINNPLTAIMGFAHQLKSGPVSAEQALRYGRLIFDEAFELSFQLENIFMAAGLEAGQEVPVPASLDLVSVLSDVVAELEHRVHEKGIDITVTSGDTLQFAVDPRFLQIMLRNLIANAVEFAPRWGSVLVEVSVDGEWVRIDVRDSGQGINPADRDTVFDRFRQLESGSSKSHRGHGLGLSICRELAGLSGGSVEIGGGAGEGGVVTLKLPLTSVEGMTRFPDGCFIFSSMEEKF